MHICGDEHYAALREIATAVASLHPITDHPQGNACFYCGAWEEFSKANGNGKWTLTHEADCLYLKAREVICGD